MDFKCRIKYNGINIYDVSFTLYDDKKIECKSQCDRKN